MVRCPTLEPPQEGRGGGPQPPNPDWQPVLQNSEVLPQKLESISISDTMEILDYV